MKIQNNNVFPVYLDYESTFKNKTVQFNCVDIFEFDNNLKIKNLTVIWDTYLLRKL